MTRLSVRTAHAALVAASLAAVASAQGSTLGTPVLSCFGSTNNTIIVQVCGDAVTGAPAGFSLHWLTRAQYDLGPDGLANTADDGSFGSGTQNCAASFSGNANNSNWNLTGSLGANNCQTVVIGGLNDADPGVSFSCNDPLLCATEYAFRVFAHAEAGRGGKKRSAFSATLFCTTAACQPTGFNDCDFVTKSQGFYGGNGGPGLAALQCYFTFFQSLTLGGPVSYQWTFAAADLKRPGNGPSQGTLVSGSNGIDDGIDALRLAVGGGGGGGFFAQSASDPQNMGTGGGLASQTAALTLNVALSGVCGFQSILQGGYGSAKLCNLDQGESFENGGAGISAATAAALNGQTVSQVLAAVNAYLGGNGAVPVPYNLTVGSLVQLVSVLNLAFHEGTSGCAMNFFAQNYLCTP